MHPLDAHCIYLLDERQVETFYHAWSVSEEGQKQQTRLFSTYHTVVHGDLHLVRFGGLSFLKVFSLFSLFSVLPSFSPLCSVRLETNYYYYYNYHYHYHYYRATFFSTLTTKG